VEAPPDPTGVPPPRPARKSALGFFAATLLLYALPGAGAQSLRPALGLAWSEVFAFLLPAAAAAAGSNLRPGPFLLLSRRPTGAQVALGLACGAAGFPAATGLMALTASLLPASWVEAFDITHLFRGPPGARMAIAAAAAVLAPLCEEAAFRGYVQSALLTRFGPAAAIASSALLFAAMHLDPVRFPAVLALGLLFGWLAWRAGSLWPAVAAHAANNGIAAALALGGVAEAGAERPDPRAALAMLAVGALVLAPAALAYRSATPKPPPPAEAMALRDPSDPSVRFRFRRVPQPYLAAVALGFALLLALAALGPAGGAAAG
jgi:uncharacterized protein